MWDFRGLFPGLEMNDKEKWGLSRQRLEKVWGFKLGEGETGCIPLDDVN